MTAASPMETQLVIGAIATWLIQKLKFAKSIPWINQETTKLNRTLSIIIAAATGVGITTTYTNGTLTVTNLTLTAVLTMLWVATKSFVLQEGWYQVVLSKTSPAQAAKPTPIIETKHYADGTVITGPAPLPDKSPGGAAVVTTLEPEPEHLPILKAT